MSEDPENEKAFTVKDRRRFDASGNRREDATEENRVRRDQEPARKPAPQARPPAQQPPPQRGAPPPPQQAQPRPQQAQPRPQPEQPPPRQAPPEMDDAEMDGMEGAAEGEAGPLGFAEFVLSIATNAVIHMGGESKDGRVPSRMNLPLAAQHIDIIAMLAEKTRGNLTRDESELLEALLYDLRMKYVSVAQEQQRGR